MRSMLILLAIGAAAALVSQADANLLLNGNMDTTQQVEVVPGFFLPQPAVWVNNGFKTISGPYLDDLSSEPWAGPAPTPVTPDDFGVFFKAFTGNLGTGDLANANLYQDVAGAAGSAYTLTGWAGAEANYTGYSEFAIDFLDAGHNMISSAALDLEAAGLFDANGQPFNYKQFSVDGVAPAGTAFVRARVSMLNGYANPLGGGQAFVADDFNLTPEPSTALLGLLLGAVAANARRR